MCQTLKYQAYLDMPLPPWLHPVMQNKTCSVVQPERYTVSVIVLSCCKVFNTQCQTSLLPVFSFTRSVNNYSDYKMLFLNMLFLLSLAKQDFCQNKWFESLTIGTFRGRETVYLAEHGNLSSHHTESRTTGPHCWTAMYADTRDINVEKCQIRVHSHCPKLEGFPQRDGWSLACRPDCFSSEIPL